MPKAIANYTRNEQERGEREGNGRVFTAPILILVVLLVFAGKASYDSWRKIGSADSTLAEKSKICMGEFADLRCNTFDLNDQCRKVFDCVQAGKVDTSAQLYSFFEGLSEEILLDYPFPTAIVGLLLLLQLKEVINGRNLHQ